MYLIKAKTNKNFYYLLSARQTTRLCWTCTKTS